MTTDASAEDLARAILDEAAAQERMGVGEPCIRVRLQDKPGVLIAFDTVIHLKDPDGGYTRTTAAILRTFKKLGVKISDEAVRRHRATECTRCQTIPLTSLPT